MDMNINIDYELDKQLTCNTSSVDSSTADLDYFPFYFFDLSGNGERINIAMAQLS